MNLEEYIESGILELYAMNALSDEESSDVERNVEKYPELREELEDIRRGLEAYTLSLSRTPRKEFKEKLLASLPHGTTGEKKGDDHEDHKAETKVIQMHPDRRVPWLAAASILLLITTSVLFFQNRSYKETVAVLTDRIENTEKQFADLNVAYTSNRNMLAELEKPETRKILMESKRGKANEAAVMFLNKETKKAIIYTDHLSKLPDNKSYQLWAIVAGKPVDLGVLKADSLQEISNKKALSNALAFAITIEKKGGSEFPTLTEMVVFAAI